MACRDGQKQRTGFMEICPFMPSDVVVVRVKKSRIKSIPDVRVRSAPSGKPVDARGYRSNGPYGVFGEHRNNRMRWNLKFWRQRKCLKCAFFRQRLTAI